VIPCTPDSYSVSVIKILSHKIPGHDSVKNSVLITQNELLNEIKQNRNENLFKLDLPHHRPQFIGLIITNYSHTKGVPDSAYRSYIQKIKKEVASGLIKSLRIKSDLDGVRYVPSIEELQQWGYSTITTTEIVVGEIDGAAKRAKREQDFLGYTEGGIDSMLLMTISNYISANPIGQLMGIPPPFISSPAEERMKREASSIRTVVPKETLVKFRSEINLGVSKILKAMHLGIEAFTALFKMWLLRRGW
jgi:hypothetical protein